MYIVVDLNHFNINNIFYQNKIKNTVMDNSNFLRILYSNELYTLNGIFIKFNLNLLSIEKSFNKYKCIFDNKMNNDVIIQICNIEKQMLDKLNYEHKKAIYRISDQLNNGFLKIFNDTECSNKNVFILKIYGIWDNDFEYGLTYKFININL